MLIEEIKVIGPKALQASIGRSLDVLGTAIGSGSALAGLRINIKTELRGDHHLFTHRLERLTHQFFVRKGSIGFGSVKIGDAEIMGGANQLDHLSLVGCRTVSRAHAHAPKPRAETSRSFPKVRVCIVFLYFLC